MRAWILADTLDAVASPDEAWQVTLEAFSDFGIDRAVWMDLARPGRPTLRSNFSKEWLEDYERTIVDGTDPFIPVCLSTIRPIPTGADYLERHPSMSKAQKTYVADACAVTGVAAGRSVTTVRGEAGWNLMSRQGAKELDPLFAARGADLVLCAQLAHAALARHPILDRIDTNLSPRQRDCLTYIAAGYRTTEVAERLDLAEATVEFHLRAARVKLGAKTRDEAVARGLLSGAITI